MGGRAFAPEAVPRKDGFGSAIKETLSRMRTEGYAKTTCKNYGYAMERTYSVLKSNGRPPSPARLTEADMATIRNAFAYSPHLLSTVDAALKQMGCRYRIPVRVPPRSRVRWLERDRFCQVLDTGLALGPPYSTLAFLESLMGFRRVSVQRARVRDFQSPLIRVRAKGAERAGNDYSMRPHDDLPGILRETQAWRVRTGREGSEYVLPSPRLGEMSESALNRILRRVSP